MASISVTPSARAASTTCSKMRRAHPAYALPDLILRKRDGLAPWPVPITCSGCPLPQLGTPHSVQCSRPAMAAQAFQNSVEMPL